MPRFRSFVLAALVSCVSAPVLAQEYPYDIGKRNPAALRAWRAIVPREYAREGWIATFAGTAGPLQSVTMRGRLYFYGSVCKPHDCGGNFVAFLVARDGAEAYGALASETLGVRKRYFGAPDAEARRLLDEALKN